MACDLLLKVINEVMRAEYQRVIFSLTALKMLFINRSVKINYNSISVCCSAVCYCNKTGISLLLLLKCLFYFLFRYTVINLFRNDSFVLSEFNLRSCCNLSSIYKILVLTYLCNVKVSFGYNIQT